MCELILLHSYTLATKREKSHTIFTIVLYLLLNSKVPLVQGCEIAKNKTSDVIVVMISDVFAAFLQEFPTHRPGHNKTKQTK